MARKALGYIDLSLVWKQGSEFQDVYSPKLTLVEYLSGLGGLFSLWLGVSILNCYDVLLSFSSKCKIVFSRVFRARKKRQDRRAFDVYRNTNRCRNLGSIRRRPLFWNNTISLEKFNYTRAYFLKFHIIFHFFILHFFKFFYEASNIP